MTKKNTPALAAAFNSQRSRAGEGESRKVEDTFIAPEKEAVDLVKITVNIPKELQRKLKLAGVEKDMTMREIVTAAVEEYLQKAE
ncbi:hypothetical protein ACUIAJ_09015 [Dermabacteraceae bacterium CCM 9519]